VNATNAGGTSAWSSVRKFTTIVAAPPAPTLGSPADNAADQATALTLSWNDATGATAYHLQVAASVTFTSITTEDSTLTATSKSITGLANSTTYYWRVKANNAGGSSTWSPARSFTTIVAAPSVPTLITPANGAANQALSLTLTWNKTNTAATYDLQYCTDVNFASNVTNSAALTDTAQAISGLTNETTYYWRVKANNAGGSSTWSPARSFTTIVAAPSVPTLSLPADNAVSQELSPTLSWEAVNGGPSYNVQVATTSAFTSTIRNDTTLATSKALNGLANSTDYYWRVRAINAGGVSAWSTARKFTTIAAAPATPTLSSPDNGLSNVTLAPTLSWSASAGAVTYHVQLATGSDFATIVAQDSTLSGQSKVFSGLTAVTDYAWRVRAKNAGGVSAWSATRTFSTTSQDWTELSYLSTNVITSLAVCNGNVFAGNFDGKLNSSSDNGASWSVITPTTSNNNIFTLFVNGSTIFGGTAGDGVIRSTDNGATWGHANAGFPDAFQVVKAFDAMGSWTFAATASGVYLSADNGNNWNTGDLSGTDFRSLTYCGSYLYAGTFDGRIYRSSNYGSSLELVYTVPGGNAIDALTNNGSAIIAGTYGAAAFRSTDDGTTWSPCNSGLPSATSSIKAFAYRDGTFFAAVYGGGVYRSTDGGVNWVSCTGNLPTNATIAITTTATHLFVGSEDLGGYRTTLP
jgi:hypothetical protein